MLRPNARQDGWWCTSRELSPVRISPSLSPHLTNFGEGKAIYTDRQDFKAIYTDMQDFKEGQDEMDCGALPVSSPALSSATLASGSSPVLKVNTVVIVSQSRHSNSFDFF